MGGKHENKRVASHQSLPIHLDNANTDKYEYEINTDFTDLFSQIEHHRKDTMESRSSASYLEFYLKIDKKNCL